MTDSFFSDIDRCSYDESENILFLCKRTLSSFLIVISNPGNGQNEYSDVFAESSLFCVVYEAASLWHILRLSFQFTLKSAERKVSAIWQFVNT